MQLFMHAFKKHCDGTTITILVHLYIMFTREAGWRLCGFHRQAHLNELRITAGGCHFPQKTLAVSHYVKGMLLYIHIGPLLPHFCLDINVRDTELT